jgi:ATP/ADP translocase/HEAT repeat protein
MGSSFGKWLGIRPGELARTAGMFAYLAMAVGAFVTGRIARDTLFLSRYDVSYLPYMYAWVALGVALVSTLYSHFADRFRRDRLIQVVTLGLLIGVVSARFLLDATGDWFLPVLYAYIEIMGCLLTIQYWTLANDLFNTREAKRLFGLVGAGGVAATIVAGSAIGSLAEWTGTENLLLICAAGLLGCLVAVSVLGRTCQHELDLALAGGQPTRGIHLGADLGRIFASKHLQTIAWITILIFVVVTIIDYQFKVIARYSFLNREDEMSEFFGWFYAGTGAVSLIIQFLVTGRLLQRFGVVVGLMLLPVALTAATGLLMMLPGIFAVTLLKAADNVLRYTVHDAGTQVLYLPVPGQFRGRAKAFITGVLKPLVQGLCGLLLAWTGTWVGHRVDWLGAGSFLALATLALLLLGLKREYIQSLVNALRQRTTTLGDGNWNFTDAQTVAALEQTLQDGDERNVLHALELLPMAQRHDWSIDLGRLLGHPSADVRLQSLRLLADGNPGAHMDRILDKLKDRDEDVQAAAIELYCAGLKEKAMGAIEPRLRDAAVAVRAAAIVGLVRYGGLDGIIAAAESLKQLLASDLPLDRKAGAGCIGRIGVKTFYRSLLPLLEDPVPAVRVEAVKSAGVLRTPELVLSLLHRLADPHTRKVTIHALAAYGPGLLTTLRTILDNRREQRQIRLAIPDILARIGVQGSLDLLANSLETDDTDLRTRALDAIVRLDQNHPGLRTDREMLRRLLHRELKWNYQLVAIQVDLQVLAADLLQDALDQRRNQGLDRIFKLLRVLHPSRHLEVVSRNLSNPVPTSRANAIELLEQVLDPETRRCLVPMLEFQDLAALAALGQELFPLLRREPSGWLHELLVDEHDWTVAASLRVIRSTGQAQYEPAVRLLLNHRSALVREEAAFCLERLGPPESVAEALAGLAKK